MLDLSKPKDALKANRKILCSLEDGKAAVFHWEGRMYSRVEGERDRHLFNLLGMNIRQCATVRDAEKGEGFRMVSRELMLYLDPKTDEILRRWINPWNGEEVDVMHVANDPVNMPAPAFVDGFDKNPFALRLREEGEWVFSANEVPLFYPNPLGGDYQDYIGNHYHVMEVFDFTLLAKDLFDESRDRVDHVAISWVRIAQFLPWMKMGSRPGLMVANAMGRKLGSFDALPQVLKEEIAQNYPTYTSPPSLDDARPNETTWTAFKKKLEGR